MADAPQMDRPSVEVIQEFIQQNPTVLRPTMPACIVGPAYQVVEAVQDDGTLNSGSLIAMPARITSPFISTPFELTGAGGDTLELIVNNGVAEQVTLPGTNPTITQAVDAINAAEIVGLVALVEASGSQQRLVLHTTGKDENSTLQIGSGTHADVLSALAVTSGYTQRGASGYTNYFKALIAKADYPDPRGNIVDLDIDYDTVRVFVNPGSGSPREALRTESFLDGASSAVSVQDDGDGDNLSPYLNFASAVFRAMPAVLTGNVDLSTSFGTFGTDTLILSIDGAAPQTVTFSNPANAAAVISQINAGLGGTYASLGVGNVLVLTSTTTGPGSSIERTGGSVATGEVGFAIGAYAGGKPSRARAQGIADLSAVDEVASVQGRTLRMSVNGDQYQSLVFPTSVVDTATLLAAINGLWGTGFATANGANNLVLKCTSAMSQFGGNESVIRIDKNASDATLLTALGLTGGGAPFNSVSAVHGLAFAPMVGDEVWVDGVRAGTVTELPAAATNRLRLDNEKLLTFSGSTWLIIAKGIDNQAATATRPSSNLRVDENSGTVTVKHEMFRDTAGAETAAGPLGLYLAYTALRLDVSPDKTISDFNLLRFGNLDTLEEQMGPIDTQNPLGLGMYFAMLNAPGIEITGCGVTEAGDTAPNGTLEGYVEAFQFLESKDVYSIVPLTHDMDVGAVGQVHVDAMSEPEMGLERIVILNPSRPVRKSSTLVASGATGNVSGAPTDVFETGIANLQALLAAAGMPGPTYTIDDAVYLEMESDTNKYLVLSVSSGSVTINDGPLVTGNTDGFFYDANNGDVFPDAVVDRPFSIKIRGELLANRTDEAAAYADIGRGFRDRRVICMAPDQAKASIDGLEQAVEGFYMAAALAGRKSAKEPQQPLTEDTLAGFTGVIGSQERYSEPQLRILCGGGLWVMYQDADGQPIRTRHQLTTDVSSVQTKESSITDALDYGAKVLRGAFQTFIGRYNITTSLMDALSMVADGIRDYFLRIGLYKDFNVVSIFQSETEPDALGIIADVETLKPANKIRITLRIS